MAMKTQTRNAFVNMKIKQEQFKKTDKRDNLKAFILTLILVCLNSSKEKKKNIKRMFRRKMK
jgi:hypothetical protein